MIRTPIKPTGVSGQSGEKATAALDFTPANAVVGDFIIVENTDQALVDAGATLHGAKTQRFEFVATSKTKPAAGSIAVVVGSNKPRSAANLAAAFNGQKRLRISVTMPTGTTLTMTQDRPEAAGNTTITQSGSWTADAAFTGGVAPTGDGQVAQAEFDNSKDGDSITWSDLDAGSNPQPWVMGGRFLDDFPTLISRDGVQVGPDGEARNDCWSISLYRRFWASDTVNNSGRIVYCGKRLTLKGSGVDANGIPKTKVTSAVPIETWRTGTTASGALSAGDTSIAVPDSSAFPASGGIKIERKGVDPEIVIYTSNAGNVFTLDPSTPLRFAHLSGVSVELSKFVTAADAIEIDPVPGPYSAYYRNLFMKEAEDNLQNAAMVTFPAGSLVTNGKVIVIEDGRGMTKTFEMDSGGGVGPSNIAVAFTAGDTASTIRASFTAAVNGVVPLQVELEDEGDTSGPDTASVRVKSQSTVNPPYYTAGMTESLSDVTTDDPNITVEMNRICSFYFHHKRMQTSELHFDSGSVMMQNDHPFDVSNLHITDGPNVQLAAVHDTRQVYKNWSPSDDRNFTGKANKTSIANCKILNVRSPVTLEPIMEAKISGLVCEQFYNENGWSNININVSVFLDFHPGKERAITREIVVKDCIALCPIDSGYYALMIAPYATTGVVENITIKDNQCPNAALKSVDARVGNIVVDSQGDSEIRNITIKNNIIGQAEGGITLKSIQSGGIRDCLVSRNTFNGGRVADARHVPGHLATFLNCEVSLQAFDGTQISGCVISNNDYKDSGAPGNPTGVEPFKGSIVLSAGTFDNRVDEKASNFPGGGPFKDFVTDLGDNNIDDDDQDQDANDRSNKKGGQNMSKRGPGAVLTG